MVEGQIIEDAGENVSSSERIIQKPFMFAETEKIEHKTETNTMFNSREKVSTEKII